MPQFLSIETADGDQFLLNVEQIVCVQIVPKVRRATVRMADGKNIPVADENVVKLLAALTEMPSA